MQASVISSQDIHVLSGSSMQTCRSISAPRQRYSLLPLNLKNIYICYLPTNIIRTLILC